MSACLWGGGLGTQTGEMDGANYASESAAKPATVIGGVVFGGFTYVMFNLVVMKILVRQSR